jgi:vancomycin resistance protein YoaR
MAKHRYIKYIKRVKWIIIPFLLSIIIVLSGLTSYLIIYSGRVYPNINVAEVSLSGYKLNDSISVLSVKTEVPTSLTLTYQDQTFEVAGSNINLSYDFTASAKAAYDYTRTGNLSIDLIRRIGLFLHPVNLNLIVNLDDSRLIKIVSVISGQISVDPIEPSIALVNNQITINKGAPGKEVDQETLVSLVKKSFTSNGSSNIEIPVNTIDDSLTQEEADELQTRTQKFISKSIQMKFEFNTFTLADTDLLNLLDPKSGYKDGAIQDLFQKTSVSVNRNPQNPKFVFLPAQTGKNSKVSEFQPALDGVKIDNEKFKDQLITSLDALENSTDKLESFDIPVIKTSPEVTTDQVNNLGIKELIGRGTSTYFHSIPGRVHNVVLAASRINGTLVAPGETFSFNQTLGDVTQFTGYQQAYIISNGKTILGDGGGVCQVSTTLFRAILNVGLPIVERAAHAYRVGYYEQDSPPGLDATVYGPEPDLKFKNDTSEYILIEATVDPKNYSLVFELYGTSDGRVATISKPVVSNVTPALPTVYQDDPTLPAGTLKQTDFSAAGATVIFNYSVKRSGEIIFQKTFISNYRPWAAVYLRGTGPAI